MDDLYGKHELVEVGPRSFSCFKWQGDGEKSWLMFPIHKSNEQWKNTGCLRYLGYEILPSYVGIAVNHYKHRIPIKQPGFHGFRKAVLFFFVAQMSLKSPCGYDAPSAVKHDHPTTYTAKVELCRNDLPCKFSQGLLWFFCSSRFTSQV